METWPMTEARAQLPTVLERVRHGSWQLIGRRGRPEAVVASAGDVEELLAPLFRFHPQVDLSGPDVGVWLPELQSHGVGETLDAALADLADVLLDYAADWEDGLRAAANHAPRAGYVRRIQLAGDVPGVVALLQGDAEVADARAADAGCEAGDG
jgi:prevent-host-death family protein